jgi:hypothetical protein
MKGYFNGAAYADLDNDGDLDMVMNAINDEAVVLRNGINDKKSISISLQGVAPNHFGFGAKVYVYSASGLQYQQLSPSRGFQSSVEPRLHFGMGMHKTVDSVVVVWPNQQYQTLKNVALGSSLVVNQVNASGQFDYSIWNPVAPLPGAPDVLIS